MTKKTLSMKKLYILAGDFLWQRYKVLGKKSVDIIKKREMPYLKDFLKYIWQNKDNI